MINRLIFVLTILFIAPLAMAQVMVLEIDPDKSEVNWEGGKKVILTDTHNGDVKIQSGTVEIDKNNELAGGEITIDMTSLKNKDVENPKFSEKLDGHLKSSDFFDVENHPTAIFTIKHIKKNQPTKAKKAKRSEVTETDEHSYTVTGDMQIRGKKNKISIPLIVQKQSDTDYKITSKFQIDRTQYNVKYNSGKFFKNLGDKVIKDEFDIALNLRTRPKAKK